MKTIRTKVYQFNELTGLAKKNAIEWYKTILNEDSDLLHFFPEYCAEIAKENGFDDITVGYSLSYCQGDGLSFKCDKLDLCRMLKEAIPTAKESLIKVITENAVWEIKGNSGRHSFAAKSDVDLWLDANKDYPNIQAAIDIVRTYIEDKYIDVCKELEKAGYAEIDYQYTDEAIIENIEANEYDFTKDGKRFN